MEINGIAFQEHGSTWSPPDPSYPQPISEIYPHQTLQISLHSSVFFQSVHYHSVWISILRTSLVLHCSHPSIHDSPLFLFFSCFLRPTRMLRIKQCRSRLCGHPSQFLLFLLVRDDDGQWAKAPFAITALAPILYPLFYLAFLLDFWNFSRLDTPNGDRELRHLFACSWLMFLFFPLHSM